MNENASETEALLNAGSIKLLIHIGYASSVIMLGAAFARSVWISGPSLVALIALILVPLALYGGVQRVLVRRADHLIEHGEPPATPPQNTMGILLGLLLGSAYSSAFLCAFMLVNRL